MAYPVRVFEPGYWYHVYTRGQRKEPLFFSPDDRKAYLSFLEDELSRRDGRVGSYCLMTNHLHLLFKMEQVDPGRIFQAVHTKYAKYFNAKRETTGHVFQGRPGMKIVLDDRYLLHLVGYIHRNPVEAGIVDDVTEYEWSSWSRFCRGTDDALNEEAWEFPPGFARGSSERTFRDLVQEGKEPPGGEAYWGTSQEWDELERRQEGREGRKYKERRGRTSKREIVEEVLAGTKFSLEDLRGDSQETDVTIVRREAMGRMYEEGHGPTGIGKFFNRTPGAVIHAHDVWSGS